MLFRVLRFFASARIFGGLAAASLLLCAIILPWLIVTARVYTDARREVFADAAPIAPALVLLPSRALHLWPWPRYNIKADSLDFARNDVDFSGPVLYGRLDAPDAIVRACRIPGREVYTWRALAILSGPAALTIQQTIFDRLIQIRLIALV